MISGYHEKIHEHYEKFPYPSYPIFALGRWKDLASVEVKNWGISRDIKDIWIAGCGTIAPLMFGRKNPDAKIIASDFSLEALRQCRRRLRLFGIRNIILKQEDLFEVGYDNCFDAVDSYGVIHHTISPAKSLQILARSLRAGGVLRLMVYSQHARDQIESLRREVLSQNLNSLENVKKLIQEKVKDLEGDLLNNAGIADALLNPLVHVFTKESLQRLLIEAGSLEVLKIEERSNYIVFLKKRSAFVDVGPQDS